MEWDEDIYYQGDILRVKGEYYILLQVDSNCYTLFKDGHNNRWGKTIKIRPQSHVTKQQLLEMLYIRPDVEDAYGKIERIRGGVIRVDFAGEDEYV